MITKQVKETTYGFIALIAALATLTLPSFGSPCLAAGPEIELVFVKGGCFQMGDTFGGGEADERPVHEVCIADFSIGKYEVTQAEWQAVMGSNPSTFTGDRRPVENVSWGDTQAFIARLNEQTGRRYRLPTEAEWEYAARSGGKKENWAGTSNPSHLDNHAWYDTNSEEKTHVVGAKRPNGLGIYDMSGNVREWVEDRYEAVWYQESPRDNPAGPMAGLARVYRGGGWSSSARHVRASSRGGLLPDNRINNLGFRLALPSAR